MHISSSQTPTRSRVFIGCLIFSIAVLVSLLPAAARIAVKHAPAPLTANIQKPVVHVDSKQDDRPVSNSSLVDHDSPLDPTSAFVVNDAGDAADNNVGNGICDTSATPGDQCTLRAAIQEANSVAGNDTISFSIAGTINLASALPNLSTILTINGPGSTLMTVRRDTGGDYRIFTVQATVAISGLTISNGKTADGVSGHGEDGGGIKNSGALTLTDVNISANSTGSGASFGASGGDGAGIFNSGTLTMTNCSINGNTSGRGGDGTSFAGSGGHGGGIFNSGTLTMTDCTVTGNTGGRGGDGPNRAGDGGDGGGINSTQNLTMTGCTVTGNAGGRAGDTVGIGTTGGRGGGIYTAGVFNLSNLNISNNSGGAGGVGSSNNIGFGGHGGGIYILNGTGTLANSSVNNNHSGDRTTGAAKGYAGGILNSGALTISRSSISGNDGSAAGGILNGLALRMINSTVSGNVAYGIVSTDSTSSLGLTNCTITENALAGVNSTSSPLAFRNTIIARNGAGGNGPDTVGSFNSQGHNLIGNAQSSTGFTAAGDQFGSEAAPLDPLLGPLADNGGSTLTHALLDGSPAVDAGDDCVTQPAHCGDANIPQLTTDQRGASFNRIVDGPDADTTATVDIGAYERQATFPDLADTSGNEDTTVVVAFEVSDPGSITSVTATSSNLALVPNNPANINVSGSGSNRIVTINPAANLSGAADITVTVNRTSGSTSKTFTLTINPVNDAPSFTKGLDQSVNENAGAQTVNSWATNISAGPADETGQTLAFQIVSNNNPSLFSVVPAISPGGTLTYTPAPGASGSAVISVALMDNGGIANGGSDTSPTQTFTINVLEGGSLQFSSSSYSVSEGTASTVITVSRFNGFAGEARVNYSTSDGSAIAGADYTATSGTLIFPDGVTTQTFTVPILNDVLDETTEVIGLHLTNPAGSGSFGVPTDSQLLIIDDDPPPSLRINDVAVTEGDSGTVSAVFTVTLSAATSFTVTANYATADGTANAGSDYQQAIGQVVLNPGDLSKTIGVTINGDTVPEVNETFTINLSGATSASIADSQGIGTILSDDAAGGTFSFNVLHDNTNENAGFATIVINRTGNTSAAATVDYATTDGSASLAPCSVTDPVASARCDFTAAIGTLRFAAGDTAKSFIVLINQDNFVEIPETLTITLSNPTGGAVFGVAAATLSGSLTIFDDATEPAANPIDDAEAFVRQHYHDFLNREPDASGLAFWRNQITSCGSDAQCIELKRINVSAAFYLSIEFQETGYLVERMYKVAYGTALGTSTLGGVHQFPVPVIRLNEFLPDTQEIARGVVVGNPGWELALETNKQLFADRFVQRSRFTAANAFPTTLTPSQFVDKLNTNAGGVLLPAERIQLINDLSTGAKTRAQVVRTIAEDSDLAIAEKNQAFVLMQYFGYLRRNPNDSPDTNHTGYDFWLNKLNQFAGNFVNAEMVKAFITSGEYRQRFGQ
ncbi:MAG TPA: Calx-beta domain-containing protein [Pyrinomonadaceae bacterium]|nr:Calx-beta domain-containing protein [Pyrinomonadaceae bacterium]